MAQSRTGGCLCGQLRFATSGELSGLCYCHCESCRRFSGATMVAWGTVERPAFRLTSGELAEVETSPGIARGYCSRCLSSLTYSRSDEPATIDIALVAFDDTAGLAPERHIWVQDKIPWLELNDGLPQFPALSGVS